MRTIPIRTSGSRVRSESRRGLALLADAPAPAEPAVSTVHMGSDGTIFHARCGQPLAYMRTRGGLDLDFYCLECVEHVTLPLHAMARVPMAARPAFSGRAGR